MQQSLIMLRLTLIMLKLTVANATIKCFKNVSRETKSVTYVPPEVDFVVKIRNFVDCALENPFFPYF